jgi:hypothetical protein
MIDDISKDFKENGICSVSYLMKKYSITREKAVDLLGCLAKAFNTLDINIDRVDSKFERIYLTKENRVVVRPPPKPKKQHDFKNTDEEWAYILKNRYT